ncbi:MAG: NINE protein [Paramuribaculum sp.]|nr:NINE protein [Paramuribaculum sp.]
MQYFLYLDNNTIGPMTADQVAAYPVNAHTLVCTTENHQWLPLMQFPELMSVINRNNNASYGYTPAFNTSGTDSKKTTAGVLALLLGWLGIQYFYLDKPMAGIISIILSIVTCGLWGTIMFIQGIIILTMSPEEFERKFLNPATSFPVF